MVGMGIVMMGPETYLPTFAQAALGLGAIAAGFILASMSIGWPVASSFSDRLYLRIGFRNTGLIGAGLVIVACGGFLLMDWPQPVWLLVADQILLGAGFGLLSTPVLVGVQSIVGWEERGVVTGANMFSRYLGQSLGAAIFGAVFNNALKNELQNSPLHWAKDQANVLHLLQSPKLDPSAKHFLRAAIDHSTYQVYTGLILFAIITFLTVWIAPRDFRLD
jgi:MFS family permease